MDRYFCFTPDKLLEVREMVSTRHYSLEELAAIENDLAAERLIKALKTLKEEQAGKALHITGGRPEVILHILKKNPEEEIKRKLLCILEQRMKKRLFEINWIMLQKDYSNAGLLDSMELLRLYMKEKHGDEYKSTIFNWLGSLKKGLLIQIVELLVSDGGILRTFIKRYGLMENSMLCRELYREFFSGCDRNGFLNNREKFFVVVEKSEEGYIHEMLNNYLTVLGPIEYPAYINELIIQRFGAPRHDSRVWAEVSEEARTNFSRWINLNTMEKFYGKQNRKYLFWMKNYMDIINVMDDKETGTLFIFLHNAVVVDQGGDREESYLYSKNVFLDEYDRYRAQKHQSTFEGGEAAEASWQVEHSQVVKARDAIIENRNSGIYLLNHEKTGILYIKEIIKEKSA